MVSPVVPLQRISTLAVELRDCCVLRGARYVLDRVSFTVPHGAKIAVAGACPSSPLPTRPEYD